MGRYPFRKKKTRGSQKWIQRAVNLYPETLDLPIGEKLGDIDIEWLSPLKSDDYAEYRDKDFLDRLGVKLSLVPLSEFWPTRGGPQWDALAKTPKGKVFLVEAKAHRSEIASKGTGAKNLSREKILRSLETVKKHMGIETNIDWSKKYYQYTNRLAHLYLLRKNKIEAYLVMVYFLNDMEMKGPTSIHEWRKEIDRMKTSLRITPNNLDEYIVEAFIDVKKLE